MPLPGVPTELYPAIAEKLGISVSHAWDLAEHDDEAASTLSISQVQILSDFTGLAITTILGISAQSDLPIQLIDPEVFCLSIRALLKAREIQLAEFEEQIGWEVCGFMDEPQRLYDTVNWDCLMDLASSVGIDPMAALPPANQLSGQDALQGAARLRTAAAHGMPLKSASAPRKGRA